MIESHRAPLDAAICHSHHRPKAAVLMRWSENKGNLDASALERPGGRVSQRQVEGGPARQPRLQNVVFKFSFTKLFFDSTWNGWILASLLLRNFPRPTGLPVE